jgi:hypothetical protein
MPPKKKNNKKASSDSGGADRKYVFQGRWDASSSSSASPKSPPPEVALTLDKCFCHNSPTERCAICTVPAWAGDGKSNLELGSLITFCCTGLALPFIVKDYLLERLEENDIDFIYIKINGFQNSFEVYMF